jgi:hypothetical protein
MKIKNRLFEALLVGIVAAGIIGFIVGTVSMLVSGGIAV